MRSRLIQADDRPEQTDRMKTDLSIRTHSIHRSASAATDPAFTPFVTASVDEIRYAQRLREQLKRRYPNRPSLAVSYWSVGAD
jgi:hypothetical protein